MHTFVDAFQAEEFCCPPEDVLAIEVRRGHRGHCNLIHHTTGFKADVYIAFDELHRWAFAHRNRLQLDTFTMSVAPVEYVILRKLEYFRKGGSEKHLRDIRDIRSMLEVSRDQIDDAFLQAKVVELRLAAEWLRLTAP